MFLTEWREFHSAPCLAGGEGLMTVRVSMLLKSRASLTWLRACFFPGRAKDVPVPRHIPGLSPKALFPFISPASRAATLSPELYKKWAKCVNGTIQLLQHCKLEFSGYSLFGITLIQGMNEAFNL